MGEGVVEGVPIHPAYGRKLAMERVELTHRDSREFVGTAKRPFLDGPVMAQEGIIAVNRGFDLALDNDRSIEIGPEGSDALDLREHRAGIGIDPQETIGPQRLASFVQLLKVIRVVAVQERAIGESVVILLFHSMVQLRFRTVRRDGKRIKGNLVACIDQGPDEVQCPQTMGAKIANITCEKRAGAQSEYF